MKRPRFTVFLVWVILLSSRLAAANQMPTAESKEWATPENQSFAFDLSGSDPDGDPLTYKVMINPRHGTLSGGVGPHRVYSPDWGFVGEDTFFFKVNDGRVDSKLAIVTIRVIELPETYSRTFGTQEDTPITFTLPVDDPRGQGLQFDILSLPEFGRLSGEGSKRGYTPNPGFDGVDQFSFRVMDGTFESNVSIIKIVVSDSNRAPTALPASIALNQNQGKVIRLTVSDPDQDPLTYEVVSKPEHGSLVWVGLYFLYTPLLNFAGEDQFKYKVNDGKLDSEIVTVNLSVVGPNQVPVAIPGSFSVDQDQSAAVILVGNDADGDELNYEIVDVPLNGVLIGVGGMRLYQPNPGFSGVDQFSFIASDGKSESQQALITIDVQGANQAPVALAMSLETNKNESIIILFDASDSDGDVLAYEMVTTPMHGTLTGQGNSRVYIPENNFVGVDTFIYKAHDGSLDSAPASVVIQVKETSPPLGAPILVKQPMPSILEQGQVLQLSVEAIDVSGMRFQWYYEGKLIPGAQSSSYRHPNAAFSDSGNYYCLVSNLDGQETASDKALVQVIGRAAVEKESNRLLLKLYPPPGVRAVIHSSENLLSWDQELELIGKAESLSVPVGAWGASPARFFHIEYKVP